jgi:hypothetical protein
MILKKAIDNLDVVLATIGIIIGINLIIWLIKYQYSEPGVMICIACATYLTYRTRMLSSLSILLSELKVKKQTYLVFNIIFFILFSCNILALISRPELYIRPLWYFISIALMASILAVEILFLPQKKLSIYFILLKILVIALNLQWSQQLIFPTIIGIDTWGHEIFTMEIVKLGYIPEGYAYSKLPAFHLIISTFSLITNSDYKISTILSINFLSIISLLFIFLIGKYLFNPKIGLLSALVFGISDWFIHFGVWTIPNTMGYILICILIYASLNMKKNISFTSITLLMSLMLILTHTMSTFIMFIILLLFWSGVKFSEILYHDKTKLQAFELSYVIVFMVMMLSYWMYVSGYIWYIADTITYALQMDYSGYAGYHEYVFKTNYLDVLPNRIGLMLFYYFSIIGIFVMLYKQFRNSSNFGLLLSGVVITFIAFTGSSLGFIYLVPGRWIGPSEMIMSIPLSIGIFSICGLFKNNFGKMFIMFLLILTLSFFMITNTTSNMDSPIYSKDISYRFAYSESEIQAIHTISRINNKSIVTDTSFSMIYNRICRNNPQNLESIVPYLLSKKFRDIDNLILIRDYIVKKKLVLWARHGFLKFDYNLQETIENEGFDKIYDSATVTAFIRS